MMNINKKISNINTIPLHSLVIMVGPSGAGKSTIVSKYFDDYEVISSDDIRYELTGDFLDQQHNTIVFSEFHNRINLKLSLGERVIADATHIRKKDRIATARIGTELNIPVYYIIVNRSISEKNKTAGWRNNIPGLIERHQKVFDSQLKDILHGDNLATVIDVRETQNINVINKLYFSNLKNMLFTRKFKGVRIIGDVHGMAEDFQNIVDDALQNYLMVISLGDIIDYGPDPIQCINIMYNLVMSGQGIMIIGNHERKMTKYLIQRKIGDIKVQVKGGMKTTVAQLNLLSDSDYNIIENKFNSLMSHARHHVILDNKYLFVHAAATLELWNITSNTLYGNNEHMAVFGEVDKKQPVRQDGYPNRTYNWVNNIPTDKTVFVGHSTLDINNIISKENSQGGRAVFMDTGSGKKGKLSYYDINII